jgi:hypothetical protein
MLVAILSIAFSTALSDYLRCSRPAISTHRQNCSIDEISVIVEPRGVYAKMDIVIVYSSKGSPWGHESNILEVDHNFSFPEFTHIVDSWLWVEGVPVQAYLVDKRKAIDIYEDIVDRRRDPSLLIKNSQTNYTIKVYPMAGNDTRMIKLETLVPFNWSEEKVTAKLPFDMVQYSSKMPTKIDLYVRNSQEFANPQISGYEASGTEIVEFLDESLMKIDYPNEDWMSITNIEFDNPMINGVYLNHAKYGDNGYYQLVVFPYMNFNIENNKDITFVLDFDQSTVNMSLQDFLDQSEEVIKNTITPDDRFNIVFADLMPKFVNADLQAATDANIEAAFDHLSIQNMSTYSNFPALMATAVDYMSGLEIEEKNIVVVSSGTNFGTKEHATSLMKMIAPKLTNEFVFYFADFSLKNRPKYYIDNNSYYGNDYIYSNFARFYGGKADYSIHFQNNFANMFTNLLGSLYGTLSSFDFHSSLKDGFCYGRQYMINDQSSYQYKSAIIEIGRYYGEFPMEVDISGFIGKIPFGTSISINDDDFVNENYNNPQIWTACKIKQLEGIHPQSNEVVTDIVDLSFDERVLSLYTAFLALEPSMTDPNDDDPNTDVEDDQYLAFDITTSPNPFVEKTTIKFTLPEELRSQTLRVKIVDASGNLVKSFNSNDIASANTISIDWDGTNNDGSEVVAGAYFVVIEIGDKKIVHKIMHI